ncbi:hypothetical protein GQR58_030500 [Nymphon striatum]|nr:hypothetical protein GQR58_030500 [Nymphon striatum]
MASAAGSTYVHNARVFTAADSTAGGSAAVADAVIADGVVWTEGSIIRYAGPADGAPTRPQAATALDAQGQFVMPGMTEGHAHLSYANAHPQQLDKQPVPVAMLDALDNARVLLGTGFTSAISFGSAQGIDVPLRDAIAQGRVPGPRLAASDRDIGSTGSNADSTAAGTEGKKLIADGPWAVRSAVRRLARSRCDIVKIFLDGEAISAHAPPGVLTYTDEEVDAGR